MATRNMRIERREPQPAVCTEVTTSDIGMELHHLLPAAFAFIEQHGGQPAGAPFTRYLEIGDGKFRIQAGMPTATPMNGSDTMQSIELPGGDIAVGDHYGPYDTVVETAAALQKWIEEQGRTASGPMWESYVTDPGAEPDADKRLTEVCYPLS